MPEIKGNETRIYVSAGTGGTGVTLVGKAFGADFARQLREAEHVSYDSGNGVNRKPIRLDGALTFKMYTDPADAGQTILRQAARMSTFAQVSVDYAERGNTAGMTYQRFVGNVSIKRGNPEDGMAVTDVTINPDGTVTEGTY
jgi:hypothetical protein